MAKQHKQNKQSKQKKTKPIQKTKHFAKKGSQRETKAEEDFEDSLMGSDYDQEMEAVEDDIQDEKNLDETVFNKFDNGELNLPSDPEDDEGTDGEDEAQAADDLDEYYRELGIDPAEMRPAISEYTTREKKETKQEIQQR